MAPKDDKEQLAAFMALANTMDAKLAARYLEGIRNLRDKDVDWATLEDYLHTGQIDALLGAISTDLVANGFAGFSMALTEAFTRGGQLAASFVQPFQNASGVNVQVTFDTVNPALSHVMAAYKMDLIQSITEDLRTSLRGIITNNVQAGINPLTSAKQIISELKDSFGLTPTQEAAIIRYKQQLLGGGLKDALKRGLRDKRFDSTVLNAINGRPISAAKAEQMAQRYREKYLKFRAETIARTESIRALNLSNYQLWHNMVDEGKITEDRIVRKWKYTHDGKARAWHVSIPSMNENGVGLKEPFKTALGPLLYPGDPQGEAANVCGCRCTVFTRIKS